MVIVLEKLPFSFLDKSKKVPSSSERGFEKRVDRSLQATCNCHLSSTVAPGPRLSKDCQTDLVNLCQERDYDFYSLAEKRSQVYYLSILLGNKLSIIFIFLCFSIPLCGLSKTGNKFLPSDSSLRFSKVIKTVFKQDPSLYHRTEIYRTVA